MTYPQPIDLAGETDRDLWDGQTAESNLHTSSRKFHAFALDLNPAIKPHESRQ
jgi:hypothetical protein